MRKIYLNPIGAAFFVFGLFILSYFIFSFAALLIVILKNPEMDFSQISQGINITDLVKTRADLIIVQVFGSLGGFLFPVLVTVNLLKGYGFEETAMFRKLEWKKTLLSCSFMVIGVLVLSALLHQINQLIPISDTWKELEKTNLLLQKKLILGTGIPHLLSSIAVVAMLPALLEELFFRGLLYNIFLKLFQNRHAAIWAQGILFGVAHFNMGQVLPIVGIGVLLGYLAAYSKNIWYGVLIHFMNNAFAVLMLFYASSNETAKKLAESTSMPITTYALGIVLLLAGLYLFFIPKGFNAKQELK